MVHAVGKSDWEACRPSALRIGVVDPKYDGERTTRKALMEESEGDEEGESYGEDSESQDGEDSESQEDESESEQEEKNAEWQENVEQEHDVSADLKKKRKDDKRKGKAVSRQIVSIYFAGRWVWLTTTGYLGCPPRGSDTNAKGCHRGQYAAKGTPEAAATGSSS